MAKLFFSYSHKDERLRDQLETHLAVLKREGLVTTWHDRRILTGDEFDKVIDSEMESADVILLLLSPDFLASAYINNIEVKRAIERRQQRLARIIPVILKPCDWRRTFFGTLLVAPTDGKPVVRWSDRNEAFLDVVEHIRAAILKPDTAQDLVRVPTLTENWDERKDDIGQSSEARPKGKQAELSATRTAKLYQKAADQGNAEAQFKLGCLYESGQGVSKDFGKAAELYQKAADQGNAEAQFKLGCLYKNGDGVPKDLDKAVEFYQKAADQGHAEAQFNLGLLYEGRQGVPMDLGKAVEFYQKAANQGHAWAQARLGWCYDNQVGVPQDLRKAAELYQKAANQGHASGQFCLGLLYKNGRGVPKDLGKAAECFQKAADQGHEAAITLLKDQFVATANDATTPVESTKTTPATPPVPSTSPIAVLKEPTVRMSERRNTPQKTYTTLGFGFGVIFLSAILVLAVFIPQPSDFQYQVFRIVLALAAGGIGAVIPGILNVNIPKVLTAGGALAVFAVVYFYSPAQLAVKQLPQKLPQKAHVINPSGILYRVHNNNPQCNVSEWRDIISDRSIKIGLEGVSLRERRVDINTLEAGTELAPLLVDPDKWHRLPASSRSLEIRVWIIDDCSVRYEVKETGN